MTFRAKSSLESGKLNIDYTPVSTVIDSTFNPKTKDYNTFSCGIELFSRVWILDLGAGVNFQVPTSSGSFGDFYFIPVYFMSNIHFYNYKGKIDCYAIYHQGMTFQKGSSPYNSGNLEDGSYFGLGIGALVFSDISIEFMFKNFSADNSGFAHNILDSKGKETGNADYYNLKTTYQTYSISLGINSLFNDLLEHLY